MADLDLAKELESVSSGASHHTGTDCIMQFMPIKVASEEWSHVPGRSEVISLRLYTSGHKWSSFKVVDTLPVFVFSSSRHPIVASNKCITYNI